MSDYKEETATRPSDIDEHIRCVYDVREKYRKTKPQANQMIDFRRWYLRDVCGLPDADMRVGWIDLRDSFDG